MKNSLALVTLAAGLSQVSATGFKNAPSFSCPDNTDNTCTDKQSSGFDWSDLPTGDFNSYGGFKWSGFTCEDSFSKRDLLAPRTFQNKCVAGNAQSSKGSSSSFGCDSSQGTDETSVRSFQVTPEFDCDLEFHYDMPDGSSCKHRSSCKSSGTTITNSQCGGAKNVTIVYPSQPSKPQETCSYGVHSISFDCSSASSTKPVTKSTSSISSPTFSATTTSKFPETTSGFASFSSIPEITSSSFEVPTTSGINIPEVSTIFSATIPEDSATTSATIPGDSVTTSATIPEDSATASATIPEDAVTTSANIPEDSATTSANIPEDSVTTSATIPEDSATTGATIPEDSITFSASASEVPTTYSMTNVFPTISTPAVIATSSNSPESSSSDEFPSITEVASTMEAITSTYVTSFDSTSTVLTTVVSTITSCAETVTNCPAHSTAVVTLTVAISTTIRPITETHVTVVVPAASPSSDVPSKGASIEGPSTFEVSATSPVASSASSPSGAVETLPVPSVVPSCLNTWMFSVGCSDNTDTACYCPDSKFAENIFSCLAAHGETDEQISEAISYFQGICGQYASNPAIATGAQSITSYLTATATRAPSASYTTIVVEATTVVPCTNEESGETITSSYSTVTISTAMTVPEIGFMTVSVSGSISVGVIPITTYTAMPVPTASSTAASATAPVSGMPTGVASYSTLLTAMPTAVGTGSFKSSSTSTGQAVVTAGAAHIGSGLGFLGFAAIAVAAL